MTEPTPLSPEDIVVDRNEPTVAVITLNRPKRRNAMSLAMWRQLGRLFEELGRVREIRTVILTGAGGAFSAGADISEFGAVRKTVEDAHAYEAANDACLNAIAACPKATIAAISGPCYGGGAGIALSCDFRVADDTAYFAIPAARLSNVYGIVETRALVEATSVAVAKEVLFSGRRYDADDAHHVGLATHRTHDDAMKAAKALAGSMSNSAPLTIKGAKVVIQAVARAETEERQAVIQAIGDEAMASEDYQEGVAAFAEKRDPIFRGE